MHNIMANLCDLFNDYNVMSLGFNCFPKRIIQEVLNIKCETHMFDYIGTSIWGINLMFDDDFEEFGNKNMYKQKKCLLNETSDNNLVHIKYNIRPAHELFNDNFNDIFQTFSEKYLRRKNRLYDLLNSNKPIIFLRLKESMKYRIVDDGVEQYSIDEFEHLKILCNKMRTKFNKQNIYVIYFSTDKQMYHKNYNIISLQLTEHENNLMLWQTCAIIFKDILLRNYEFIKRILKDD